jgi:hypothetical protein
MGKTRSMCHQPISSLLFMKLKVLKHFQSFILFKTIAIDNWMNLDLTQAMEKELVAIKITPHLFARIINLKNNDHCSNIMLSRRIGMKVCRPNINFSMTIVSFDNVQQSQ